MEGIAIGIAKKALDSVVSTASTAITDEIGLLLGVQEELFFIKEELEMMQAFLRVASAEEAKGEIVTTWVKQVKELSYDVEDCLQEASVHLMKKGYLSAMLSSKARHRIAQRIKVLRVRIEDVSKRNLRYGLIKSSTENVPDDSMEKPVPHWNANEEASVVGLSKPKKEVLKRIFENPDAWKVISVVGMGGRGKTTLVKTVHGSPELSNQFQCFAWITILHPFIVEEFVIRLARELPLLDQEERTKGMKKRRLDMEELIKMINEHVKDKKYAIVLDDLASETEWTKIKSIFQNEVKGSRFLVTTRSESLAESISMPQDIYRLPELSEHDSLDLFYRAVYKNSDYTLASDGKSNCNLKKSKSFPLRSKEEEQTDNNVSLQKNFGYSDLQQEIAPKQVSVDSFVTEEMETQANEIIERCGKLPLAIVAIGSFLATKPKTGDEWNKMHKHISSEIHNNPHLESIMTVLTTSYDGLPYHLKSCFLYLCVFHNHHKIRRSRIVRRWMAEGFMVQRRDMTTEEVGEHYFYDLMGRSLIQPSEPITIENDAVTQCNIHDLLYELIVAKAENENIVSCVGDRSHIKISGKARHVVIQDGLEEKSNALRSMKLNNIRSVTGFGKVGNYVEYHKMRLLRVLDLEGTLKLKNQDLKRIGRLRHLKYLGLRGTSITKLPGSLKNLHDLETLDIRDTWVLKLPKGIVKLQKLSYLRAGFDVDQNFGMYNSVKFSLLVRILVYLIDPVSVFLCQRECSRSEKEELVMNALLSPVICGDNWRDAVLESLWAPRPLKNFGSLGMMVPQGIGKLMSLHNFGTVDIGQSKGLVKELQCLTNLTKVAIVGFSEKNGKLLGEAIEKLVHLRSLLLSASDELGLSYCLESIKSPPMYLKCLKLFSPINKLPDWFSSLHNLVKLHFRNTKLGMEDIILIEKLSSLKILFMLEESFEGDKLCFRPNTFPVLQVMFLNCIKGVRRDDPIKLLIDETALKGLVLLKIYDEESFILFKERMMGKMDSEHNLIPRWELEGLEFLISLKEVVLDDLNADVVERVQDLISRNPNKPDVRCLNIPKKLRDVMEDAA